MKNNRLLFFVVACVIALALLSYFRQPRVIDWRLSYSSKEKIPYGAFVLYELLPQLGLMPEEKNRPLSEWLPDAGPQGKISLVMIAADHQMGRIDAELLLNFVSKGNAVFLAAESFPDYLLDELEITLRFQYNSDTLNTATLVNPAYQNDSFYYTRSYSGHFFELSEQFGGRILGIDADHKEPEFIAVPYGKGKFFLHSAPKYFTNIHLLENPGYAARCLSYLSRGSLFWDEYYKPMARVKGDTFQAVKNNPALSYAWWLLLAGSLLAVLFFAKRRQRAIPVMPMPENKSLEFVETVGDLYLDHGQHIDLVRKKIAYFYHYTRQKYFLNENDPLYWQHLAMKSAADPKTLDKIRELIEALPRYTAVDAGFLIRFNNHIETFYHQTGKYHSHERISEPN